MADVITGSRSSATYNTETTLERDVFPALLELEPNKTPLTVLSGKTRKKIAETPKFEWFEVERLPQQDLLTATITAAATTMVVTNYKYFRARDVVLIIETGEQVLVTATPTTTTVTITRAWGEVSAAATTNASGKVKIMHNSNEEGADIRSILSVQKVPKFNYVGIVREPFSVTGTAKVTKTYGGIDFDHQAEQALMNQATKVELMHLQGQRYEDTTGTNPARSSRGAVRWITTNVLNVGGALTEPVWDSYLRRVSRYGSDVKVLLNAPIVTGAISGFAKDKLRISDVMQKKYGMKITEYITPYNTTFLLANHNLMTNDSLQDFDDLAGMSICVDMAFLEVMHTKGRMAVRLEKRQGNGIDGRTDEYLSEVGLRFSLEKTGGKATGCTD